MTTTSATTRTSRVRSSSRRGAFNGGRRFTTVANSRDAFVGFPQCRCDMFIGTRRGQLHHNQETPDYATGVVGSSCPFSQAEPTASQKGSGHTLAREPARGPERHQDAPAPLTARSPEVQIGRAHV